MHEQVRVNPRFRGDDTQLLRHVGCCAAVCPWPARPRAGTIEAWWEVPDKPGMYEHARATKSNNQKRGQRPYVLGGKRDVCS